MTRDGDDAVVFLQSHFILFASCGLFGVVTRQVASLKPRIDSHGTSRLARQDPDCARKDFGSCGNACCLVELQLNQSPEKALRLCASAVCAASADMYCLLFAVCCLAMAFADGHVNVEVTSKARKNHENHVKLHTTRDILHILRSDSRFTRR